MIGILCNCSIIKISECAHKYLLITKYCFGIVAKFLFKEKPKQQKLKKIYYVQGDLKMKILYIDLVKLYQTNESC